MSFGLRPTASTTLVRRRAGGGHKGTGATGPRAHCSACAGHGSKAQQLSDGSTDNLPLAVVRHDVEPAAFSDCACALWGGKQRAAVSGQRSAGGGRRRGRTHRCVMAPVIAIVLGCAVPGVVLEDKRCVRRSEGAEW